MPYADPARQRAYQQRWYAQRRADWFEGKACIDCGTTSDLQVDHVDPRCKVNHRVWSWSLPRRETELAKCVARCKTCHKIKSRDEVARGLVNGMSKLNNEKVWDIRLRVIHGESYRSIAKVYDVDFSLVGYIARREIWRHI